MIRYKSKITAFNGIYLWLQNNNFVKVTKNTQFSQDQSAQDSFKLMVSFAKMKNWELPKKVNFDKHHDRLAIKIQPVFREFVSFVKSNNI